MEQDPRNRPPLDRRARSEDGMHTLQTIPTDPLAYHFGLAIDPRSAGTLMIQKAWRTNWSTVLSSIGDILLD